VIILPLIVSGISHPDVIKQLFLVPDSWLPISVTLKNTAWGVAAIFIKAPTHPLIMANLPIINLVALALGIFGIYALQAAARAKAIWLCLSIVLAIVAAGLNNNVVFLALGLPAMALLISAGLRYLYIEWRAIFPRNPVPKTFALILIAGVVATQVYYGIRYSLIAWPHTSATRSVYVLK